MKSLGHGANVTEMARVYGVDEKEIVDFSSNINPYVSTHLEAHLKEVLASAVAYPDHYYTRLREQIACYLNCGKEQVIVGNGATEIMYLLMKSIGPIRLGIVNPTFSEYERSARMNGLEVVDFYLKEGRDHRYYLDLDAVEEKLESIDALFICNPNNPTGQAESLDALLNVAKEADKWLIVDETFMEFVEGEETYSLVEKAKGYSKLVIIKAITKFYGLPGLRMGYGVISHQMLLETMYYYKEPWTVNSFAEKLTGILLEDVAYQKRSKAYFKEERAYMREQLRQIPELIAYESECNFILLKLKEPRAKALQEQLLVESQLLIRDASNFKGLDAHFIRVAIKTRRENERLITALKKISNA